MYSYDRFIKSPWSLVVISDGRIIFRSRASALKPLVRYLKSRRDQDGQVIIYDKYIGRAAALLMTLIKPREVHTPVISEGGRQVLEQYRVRFHADREVKFLMGVASDQMCGWEKMSVGKTPSELWDMLK